MPLHFWVDAIQTAVFLVNRIHSLTVLRGRLPYETLHGCSFSDLQFVRVFECLCYLDIQNIAAHKVSTRSLLCFFLGLSDKHKGFHCLHSSTGKVFISQHVTFIETIFYFLVSLLMRDVLLRNPIVIVSLLVLSSILPSPDRIYRMPSTPLPSIYMLLVNLTCKRLSIFYGIFGAC